MFAGGAVILAAVTFVMADRFDLVIVSIVYHPGRRLKGVPEKRRATALRVRVAQLDWCLWRVARGANGDLWAPGLTN